MFNKFDYEQMLLSILTPLWRNVFIKNRKEKLICVQHEIQRRINEGSYE